MNVSILGTGNVAANLGQLLRQAGHSVVFGARDVVTAQTRLQAEIACDVRPLEAAAAWGEIVIMAIPFTAARTMVTEIGSQLAEKIVVDLTNPLNADWSPLLLGAENSAGEELARSLPKARLVKAFNTIFADVMKPGKNSFGATKLTAFVCGNHADANQVIAALAEEIGFAPLIVGDIKNARYLEAIAHLNIQIAVGMQGGTDAGFAYLQR